MGIYLRKDSSIWWIGYRDAQGVRQLRSTGFAEKAKAEACYAAVLRRVEEEKVVAAGGEMGPPRLRVYGAQWIAARRARGVVSVSDDESSLRDYVYPFRPGLDPSGPLLGDMRVTEIRRVHIYQLFQSIMATSGLAPRSIRHIYETLHALFAQLVAIEAIPSTPCTLSARRDELPRKRDKDPAWRATAVYTRAEVETLLSCYVIPRWRRALYALLFLGGLRVGEALARLVGDINRSTDPRWELLVATSFSTKLRRIKGTKTDQPRRVPVHVELQRILDAWLSTGWRELMGREPAATDPIIPGITSSKQTLRMLRQDLEKLGLRARRQHDTRRTFITLARSGGAVDAFLKWVTHGPGKNILDDYSSPPWNTLCAQVDAVRISVPDTSAVLIRAVEGIRTAAVVSGTPVSGEVAATVAATVGVGGTGIEPVPACAEVQEVGGARNGDPRGWRVADADAGGSDPENRSSQLRSPHQLSLLLPIDGAGWPGLTIPAARRGSA